MSRNVGPPPEVTAREVSEMLGMRAEALCGALGLVGRIEQGALTPLNPTRRDRRPGSFVIDVAGPKRGRWNDYATGDYGDALDLVAYVLFGGWPISREAKREALRWGRRWLGLGDGPAPSGDSPKMARARAAYEEAKARAEAMALNARDRSRRRAQAMFLEAAPLTPDTPGWRYLTGRGIELEKLERLPWAVRSHAGLRHVETDRVVPCLISALLFADGTFGAVHRVFLEPDGSRKLDAGPAPVKKIWPSGWRGAVIPVSRGVTRLAPRVAHERGLTDEAAYAEGVEDAFSVALLAPEWRVSAAGSSGNFAAIEPPACARAVIVARDNDRDRKVRAGVDAKVAELRARCEARDLPLFESFPDRGFKDFNDMLQGRRSW